LVSYWEMVQHSALETEQEAVTEVERVTGQVPVRVVVVVETKTDVGTDQGLERELGQELELELEQEEVDQELGLEVEGQAQEDLEHQEQAPVQELDQDEGPALELVVVTVLVQVLALLATMA
jgi:hypothetical protein